MDQQQLIRKFKSVTAYCVVTNDINLFQSFAVQCNRQEIAVIENQLHLFHASKFLRLLARRNSLLLSQNLIDVQWAEQGAEVWLNGFHIGSVIRLFKRIQPYEAQSRIAYDVFYQRLYEFLARDYQIVVLHDSENDLELFVPTGRSFDWAEIWDAAVKKLFGLENLRKSFVALVNSIKLTNRGFSALDVPIINSEQAQVLAAFDLTNLLSLQIGDKRREQEITKIDKELLTTSDPKKIEQIQKNRQKLDDELETRRTRYGGLYEEWNEVLVGSPKWSQQVIGLAKTEFSPTAGTQIAKVGVKIGKAVQQIKDLSIQTKFYQLPTLLEPVTNAIFIRAAGDSNTKICYGCGVAIPKGAPVFQANSFIFASPSQRLQSGGSQTQPNVCGTCAALSFTSPIKLGEGRLVIRLHQRGQKREYMLDDQLRMLALGDFNIVAGRYALLQANETIGNKPLIDQLGGVQYAIYKIATLFLPEVFEVYEPEIIIGEAKVALNSRHVAWMHRLNQTFNLQRRWEDKGQFAAFGRAIRHLQQDDVIYAIYELLKGGLHGTTILDRIRAIQLETLRSEHVRWLKMDNQAKRSEFYRDVAGMTGLLYAFCDFTKRSLKTKGENDTKVRTEVRKLIERTNDPYQFDYTAAANTEREFATLYRSQDMYFSYDETKRLLEWLDVATTQRETVDEKGQAQLKLNFDDVVKAYTQLFEEKYSKSKEQREFLYALKLSLHARFPELMERQEEK
ncbi:MAG: hypothetical protein NT075_27655 [Chloroflexi bacterium]|nr:hypothetical protein [Chloroflexota bacterium]